MRRNSLRKLALAGAVAAVVGSLPLHAQAATGNTDVDITVGSVVVLHYFSNVDVNLTSANMLQFLTGGTNDAFDEGTQGASGFQADLAMTPSALGGGDPTDAELQLQNAWAVRAIVPTNPAGGGAPEVEVEIESVVDTLQTANGAEITITSFEVGSNTTNAGNVYGFPSPGLVNPEVGSVYLGLDLSNAYEAAEYTNGQFRLTARPATF